MSNKLTLEQNKRLDNLEYTLKLFLNDIEYLRKNGEEKDIDVSSLFDDLYDVVKELN